MAVNMAKTKIKLIKAIYIGMSILFIEDFYVCASLWQNQTKARWQGGATDDRYRQLVFHIETEDVCEDMLQERDAYDISEYLTSHKLFSVKNKRLLGKNERRIRRQYDKRVHQPAT